MSGDPAPDPASSTAEWARFTLEKLQPGPGDVLVLRGFDPTGPDVPAFVQPTDPLDIIGAWLKDHDLDGVLVVALGSGQDLQAVDEAQMAEMGWVRRPQ